MTVDDSRNSELATDGGHVSPESSGAVQVSDSPGSLPGSLPGFLNGSPAAPVMEDRLFVGGLHEELSGGDRLSLYNFLSREFGLDAVELITDSSEWIATRDRYEGLKTGIDLLVLGESAIRDRPLQPDEIVSVLSPRGMVCIERDPTRHALDGGHLLMSAGAVGRGTFEPAFESKGLSLLVPVDGERSPRSIRYQVDLFLRKREVHRSRADRLAAGPKMPEVAVFVLAQDQEDGITDCLRAVLGQRGSFEMRVLVIDNASADTTAERVRKVMAEHVNGRAKIDLIVNPARMDAKTNWAQALTWAKGADFVAPCGGDDLWTSDRRLEEHVNFLRKWPKAVMSYNPAAAATDAARRSGGAIIAEQTISGADVVVNNPIACLGATVFRGEMADVLPVGTLLEAEDGNDIWTLGIYSGQIGPIGNLNKPLTTSRRTVSATFRDAPWSISRASSIVSAIGARNALFDFNFWEECRIASDFCYGVLGNSIAYTDYDLKKIDLIVLDDTFPTPKNGFRYLEFTEYLREFPSSLVLSTGAATGLVDPTPHDSLILSYQRKYPELGNRVMAKRGRFPLHLARLVYTMFLHNTYAMLPEIEEAGVDFAFTLYPGGGFALNNPDVDRQLARVFASPFFRKVIVTQKVIYEYLIGKSLCPPDRIEIIYGGVMPEAPDVRSLTRRRWGFEKTQLDICFMAHKYTPRGEDKGYDVFVEVARILAAKYDNIFFHVAGGFDQHVIDVSALGSRIKFHGPLGPDKFDEFFQGMDIILSPNISGKIYSGSTDGFPTGCCVEAGMRGTAIFATDEFGSVGGSYIDGRDVIVVNYDVADIVKKIEAHYRNPEALKALGERAIKTLRDVHSLEAQMGPRIQLLRGLIARQGYTGDAAPVMVPVEAPPAAPTSESVALRVKIASLQRELADREAEFAVLLFRQRRLFLLVRGLYRFVAGHSDKTLGYMYHTLATSGLRGVARAILIVGS